MMGVAQGTCASLLEESSCLVQVEVRGNFASPNFDASSWQELTRNLSTSTYTMITNGQVLKSCSTDGCNNPDDEIAGAGLVGWGWAVVCCCGGLAGCPAMVDRAPAVTDGIRPLLSASM